MNRIDIINLFNDIKSKDGSNYFSTDWIVEKMLNLEKNNRRKYKINKIYEQTRKI